MKFINLTFLFLLIPFLLLSQTSKQSGNWSENSTWIENKQPGSSIINNATIIIKEGHVVVLETNTFIINNKVTIKVYGELVIDANIDISNNCEIYIAPEAKLYVNGNINVSNNIKITVDESGIFDLDGTIKMDNNAAFNIDGVFNTESISGSNNNNIIIGNGVVYSETISNFEINEFKGIIVGDKTDLTLPFPLNFQVRTLDYALLKWDFEHFDGFGDYKFVGFQVLKTALDQHITTLL